MYYSALYDCVCDVRSQLQYQNNLWFRYEYSRAKEFCLDLATKNTGVLKYLDCYKNKIEQIIILDDFVF